MRVAARLDLGAALTELVEITATVTLRRGIHAMSAEVSVPLSIDCRTSRPRLRRYMTP